MPKPKPTKPAETTQSLAAFMQAKARAGCVVCRLPEEVRSQLGRAAVKRGFSREDQVEWLRSACGVGVTHEELSTHLNGRHDRPEGAA